MTRMFLAAACAAVLSAFATGSAFADVVSTNVDGTITYNGDTGEADSVTIGQSPAVPARVRFTATGDTIFEADPGCVHIDNQTTDCNGTRVVVNGNDNADTISAPGLTGQTITINGGDGEDSLTGGALADTVNGGNDPDIVSGASGNDSVNGEAGEDLVLADDGSDRMDGGAGDDRFSFVVAPLFPGVPFGTDEVVGGAGLDHLAFTAADGFPFPTAKDITYTLDDQANDGFAGQGSNVRSDVESLAGASTEAQEAPSFFGPGQYYTGPAIPEGRATLRGNDGFNTLMGTTANDDLDPGNGNDSVVGGDGDDAIRTTDGFADRVKCGPGNDTATADQLDVVSDSCENVTRSEVANANDVPEDRPPTVSFDAPAPGAVTTGVTVLVASAADDRGVPTVQFLDDDRIVCTDNAPPYTCDYQPRGEDVGRNTLSVVAIDSAQQTASAGRVFTVPRFGAPVSLRLRPAKDTKAPFSFRATGAMALPATVTPALGCVGAFVAVQVKAGGTTISNRRVRLQPDCTYSSRVSFASRKRFKTRRSLRVYAVFAGNEVLAAARSSVRRFAVR